MQQIKKGGEVELQVEKLAFGGQAIARVEGFVVFLERALPGQKVVARITRKKRQYAEGRVLDVLAQSPHYDEPFCPHFGFCGGCRWQDLVYDQQLHWKRQHVLESLEHLAGVEEATVEPAIPSPQTRWYRNKMEYTFTNRRWLLPQEIASTDIQYGRDFALGLHVRGFFDKVFDVDLCFLQSQRSVEIMKETREWCRKSGLAAYTTATHQGYWRFLVIREGKRTDQTLVHVITSAEGSHEDTVDSLAEHLLARFPSITTLVHSVSGKKAQVAFGDFSRNVFGPGFIEERLGSLTFRISAHSFFQTNPLAAEKLYETVVRFGEFSGKETVWDLYCGTGSIALSMASQARRVVGFEVVDEAVKDAYDNCRLNGIDNCVFHAGDLKDVITAMDMSTHRGEAPDVVVTDPPRAGMHPHVVRTLMEFAPPRIIAVSCNPATLARDLATLLDLYEIKKVQPFDLFPHTPHIECVVKLERK